MTTAGNRELYVYYRVDPTAAAEALDVIRDWQLALVSAHAGLSARVLRKEGRPGEAPTFMEIYRCASGVSIELQASIERSATALGDRVQGSRHVEVFIG
jgi:hypothetical protein